MTVVDDNYTGHVEPRTAALRTLPGASIVKVSVGPMDNNAYVVTCSRTGELIELDFPATPPAEAPVDRAVLDALGTTAVYFGRSRFDVLVQVPSAAELRSLRPDLRKLAETDARGVIVALTPHGFDVYRTVAVQHASTIAAQVGAGLDDAELRTLTELCTKLRIGAAATTPSTANTTVTTVEPVTRSVVVRSARATPPPPDGSTGAVTVRACRFSRKV